MGLTVDHRQRARPRLTMYAVNSPDWERPGIRRISLRRKLPDIDDHDVFLCGPPGFAQGVYEGDRPLFRRAVSTTSRSRCERREPGAMK